MNDRLLADLEEAERKAWEALSRYKFQMFGYWSAIWVHQNRIGEFKRANPWAALVHAARHGNRGLLAPATHDHRQECERYGGGLSVRRAFVTLIDAGEVPDGKGPFVTDKHLWQFVREAIAGRPSTTQIIVHELTWNGELWTQCGREMIKIDKMLDTVEGM